MGGFVPPLGAAVGIKMLTNTRPRGYDMPEYIKKYGAGR